MPPRFARSVLKIESDLLPPTLWKAGTQQYRVKKSGKRTSKMIALQLLSFPCSAALIRMLSVSSATFAAVRLALTFLLRRMGLPRLSPPLQDKEGLPLNAGRRNSEAREAAVRRTFVNWKRRLSLASQQDFHQNVLEDQELIALAITAILEEKMCGGSIGEVRVPASMDNGRQARAITASHCLLFRRSSRESSLHLHHDSARKHT